MRHQCNPSYSKTHRTNDCRPHITNNLPSFVQAHVRVTKARHHVVNENGGCVLHLQSTCLETALLPNVAPINKSNFTYLSRGNADVNVLERVLNGSLPITVAYSSGPPGAHKLLTLVLQARMAPVPEELQRCQTHRNHLALEPLAQLQRGGVYLRHHARCLRQLPTAWQHVVTCDVQLCGSLLEQSECKDSPSLVLENLIQHQAADSPGSCSLAWAAKQSAPLRISVCMNQKPSHPDWKER